MLAGLLTLLAGWRAPAAAAPIPKILISDRAANGRAYLHKFPRLLPVNDSAEAFAAWMLALGEDPAGPDAMDIYAEVCDLAGWTVPWPELPEAMPAPHATAPTGVAETRRPLLAGADAAHLFVTWIRETDRCGTYSSDEFAELYREHTEAAGLEETPESTLRGALKKLPGVSCAMADVRGAPGTRRRRSLHYTISQDELSKAPIRLAA